jgi:hypothetical protein
MCDKYSGIPIQALVSVEAKKKKGRYEFKLLAVDVPAVTNEQRIYLEGILNLVLLASRNTYAFQEQLQLNFRQ